MKKTDLQGYRKNFIKFMSVFMVIFPWITYLNISKLTENEKMIFTSYEGMWIDFFVQSKQSVLLAVAVIALLWFIGERFLPEKVDNQVPLLKGNNRWLFVLSGIFAVGIIISTMVSEYSKNALWGAPMIGEGMWTLLAYLIIILIFYNSFAYEYGFSMFKKALTILFGITTVLTFIEWFYKPLLEIGLIQKIVAPAKYSNIVSSMKADRFTDAISLTFYNPGYLGGFVCLLLPFALSFCLRAKQIKEKILYGILSLGLLFGVIASGTTTTLLVALFEVFLVVIVYFSFVENQKRAALQGGVVILIALVGLVAFGEISGNSFLNILSNDNSVTMNDLDDTFEIKDIHMEGNSVLLVGEEKALGMFYENGKCVFRDGNGKMLQQIRVEDGVVFEEDGYENLKVSGINISGQIDGVDKCILVDAGYLHPIDFFVLEDGTFSGIGQGSAIVKDIGDAGTLDNLKKYYGWFTGRGYAWINSLPILKETLLIGKGPGNFAYYFKHFDYVGMLTTHKTVKQIIDKPHSAYIQYATEVGLPAAIAFFGIFVGALIKGAKLFWKNRKTAIVHKDFHIAALVSVAGFLIYSIINDSMITVTPIACMIAGALLASCYMMEEKK